MFFPNIFHVLSHFLFSHPMSGSWETYNLIDEIQKQRVHALSWLPVSLATEIWLRCLGCLSHAEHTSWCSPLGQSSMQIKPVSKVILLGVVLLCASDVCLLSYWKICIPLVRNSTWLLPQRQGFRAEGLTCNLKSAPEWMNTKKTKPRKGWQEVIWALGQATSETHCL